MMMMTVVKLQKKSLHEVVSCIVNPMKQFFTTQTHSCGVHITQMQTQPVTSNVLHSVMCTCGECAFSKMADKV